MESWIIAQLIEAFAINAEIQSMIAENQLRTIKGESPAYGESHFQEKAQYLWGIANGIMQAR